MLPNSFLLKESKWHIQPPCRKPKKAILVGRPSLIFGWNFLVEVVVAAKIARAGGIVEAWTAVLAVAVDLATSLNPNSRNRFSGRRSISPAAASQVRVVGRCAVRVSYADIDQILAHCSDCDDIAVVEGHLVGGSATIANTTCECSNDWERWDTESLNSKWLAAWGSGNRNGVVSYLSSRANINEWCG